MPKQKQNEKAAPSSMARYMLFGSLAIVVAILVADSIATLSSSDRGKKKKTDNNKVKLSAESVVDRGLVSESIKAKEILGAYKSYCDVEREVKHFDGLTLGYVTPWNGHGYDIAKIFGHKFSYVSPVWLQLKRKPSGAFVIEGGHDIDKGWVDDVTKGRKVQMVPRLLFDGWSSNDYKMLFASEDAIEDCVKTIVKYIRSYKFHGVVLEVWSQLGGQRKGELSHLLEHLSEEFRKHGKRLVLVLPPPLRGEGGGGAGMLSRDDFEDIIDYVDAVSLMTYDYSNAMRPGPNSPVQWMRECVEKLVPNRSSPNRRKILLGLNFYGNDYTGDGGGGPIVGNQYIELLEKHKPKFSWDSRSMEHVFKYKTGLGQRTVYYPTLYSVQKRIALAKELGTGLSIWEIGQGLDYFYDLL